MNLESRRNALALSIGWWLLRRKVKQRAATAVAGLLAGAGLPGVSAPRRSHRLRTALLALALVGGAAVAWRRLRGGADDEWGSWQPEPPPPAPPAEGAPLPEHDPAAA